MTKERQSEILRILREQDVEIDRIFSERLALAKECIAEGRSFYHEMWDKLHSDKKQHWDF